MHKRLCFALALASSPLCAQEPVDNDTPVPDTAPASMTEEQKLNDCLLRSAQTANGKVTLQEMRGWCTNGEEQDKISAHEDALRARLALENTTQGNPFVITPHRRNYLLPYSYWSNRQWNDLSLIHI